MAYLYREKVLLSLNPKGVETKENAKGQQFIHREMKLRGKAKRKSCIKHKGSIRRATAQTPPTVLTQCTLRFDSEQTDDPYSVWPSGGLAAAAAKKSSAPPADCRSHSKLLSEWKISADCSPLTASCNHSLSPFYE